MICKRNYLRFRAADKGKSGGKAGTAAPAAAATGTGTGAAAKTAAKPEVKVHTALAQLVKQLDQAAEKAGSLLVEVGELIVKENLSNPVIIKTFMEVRGVTEATAKSQVSRIRTLLKDTDQFEALKRGEVTVRAAVKSAQTRRAASSVSKAKKFDQKLAQFVTAAKDVGQDRKTIVATVEAALDKAGVK